VMFHNDIKCIHGVNVEQLKKKCLKTHGCGGFMLNNAGTGYLKSKVIM